MRKATIGILGFVAVFMLAGVVSAGNGVWVSDTGEQHKVGSTAIFLDGEGDSFDLSELADGETKVFGGGDKQITASRRGDTIFIEHSEDGDGRPVSIECEVGQDSCRVMTFGDDDSKVALMIKKRHLGLHVMSIDEDVMLGGDGETTITITQVGDCEDGGDADCLGKKIEILDGSALRNVWVSAVDPHRGPHAMMVADGATKHDLGDLNDGETRIFGYGERQVSAVREGDKVSITRPQGDDAHDVQVTCTIGRDSCQVLTYDDDPEKVVVMIAKTAGCDAGAGDCSDLLRLHMQDVHEGAYKVKVVHEVDHD
jgi:hypothetical protein